MNKTIFSALVGVLLLSGCSSVRVKLDYDRTTDFSGLKTYAWQQADQPVTGNPRIDNDLIDKRVRQAVDEVLLGKGFQRTDPFAADFLVVYFIDYKQRISGSSISFGIGGGSYGRYGGVGYNTHISDYDEGYLTIDMVSPDTGKTVWRGVGIRVSFDHPDPAKTTKIINTTVSRILKRFPPKK